MKWDAELPRFLYGCFDWRVNGLHWDQAPEIDLLSGEALDADNPWIVLAAVVERAKQGDHRQAPRLAHFATQKEPFALDRVSLLALGEIALSKDLDLVEHVLRADDGEARVHAAEAAALSGALRLVPAMLSAWLRAESGIDHDVIGFALSGMLEAAGGPIANHVDIFNVPRPTGPPPPGMDPEAWQRLVEAPPYPPSPFPELVQEAHARLEKAYGADGVVWQGRPMNIVSLAQQFLAQAKSDERHNFIDLRHRFESYTGIDCRKFYFAMEPQRLQMAAVLEDFLNSREATGYQPGRRYFFGHQIRD